MWGLPAFLKIEAGKKLSIDNRSSDSKFDRQIAVLVFPGKDKQGNFNAVVKSRKSLQNQYAMDKIRTIVYFLGYKAMMKSSDYDSFDEITKLLSDIYQCRNMNHRGNSQSQWEKETYDKIFPLKSLYYFKFLGVLAQYVEYIKDGWGYIPELKKYSDSIEKQKISAPQPPVRGKIELKDDKKRFKNNP